MIVSVWDDAYGISVPNKFHTTKSSISEILRGFQRNDDQKGYEIFVVKGWDYEALDWTYENAARIAREEHVPVLIHVVEVTQPQGHSTSGSHERYKSKDRLNWEKDNDCILKFRNYLIQNELATIEELDAIEQEAKAFVKQEKDAAWRAFSGEIKSELNEAVDLLKKAASKSVKGSVLEQMAEELNKTINPIRKDVISIVSRAIWTMREDLGEVSGQIEQWYRAQQIKNEDRYSSHLYSQSEFKVGNIKAVPVEYQENASLVDGREILQACFDKIMEREPRFLAFGEDVGKIGDVNQAFAGLQAKYGESRVTDTGIRECTIIGQGIGAALRGLRPMAEIQYLDYIYYALMTLADDLSCFNIGPKEGKKHL
jgi:hypothetical protein